MALDSFGDAQAGNTENLINSSSQTSTDSLADKLRREVDLFKAAPQATVSGFTQRLKDLKDDPMQAVPILATGLVVGALTSLAIRNPKAAFGAGQFIKNHPRLMVGGFTGLDLAGRTVEPALDTWNNPGNLERNQADLGYRLGSLPSDYLMGLPAGAAGAKIPGAVSGLSRLAHARFPAAPRLALEAGSTGTGTGSLSVSLETPRSGVQSRIANNLSEEQRLFGSRSRAAGGDTTDSGKSSQSGRSIGDDSKDYNASGSDKEAAPGQGGSNAGDRGQGKRGTDGRGSHDDGLPPGDDSMPVAQGNSDIDYGKLESMLGDAACLPSELTPVLRRTPHLERVIKRIEELRLKDDIGTRNDPDYDGEDFDIYEVVKSALLKEFGISREDGGKLLTSVLNDDLNSQFIARAAGKDVPTPVTPATGKLDAPVARPTDGFGDQLHYAAARKFLIEGKLPEAEQLMADAIRIAEGSAIPVPRYRVELAQIKTRLGKDEEALTLLRRAWDEVEPLEIGAIEKVRIAEQLAAAEQRAGNPGEAGKLRQLSHAWFAEHMRGGSGSELTGSKSSYDGDLQMFRQDAQLDMKKLAFLKYLYEQGRLEPPYRS